MSRGGARGIGRSGMRRDQPGNRRHTNQQDVNEATDSLAEIAVAQQNWERLEETSERALATVPMPSPQLYVYNAVALFMLNRHGEAEVSALNTVQKAGCDSALIH